MPTNFDDIIFCSFYTNDAYYTAFADDMKARLTAMGIAHEIMPIDKAADDKWIDICRKKVPFIYEVCQRHPTKKVFWIDVDCHISRLPDFVAQSSADIIGFQRGFSNPLRLGYHLRSRFWEPCFWGISTSKEARDFIRLAFEAERDLTVFATDDYFFEEAWRVSSQDLSFQIIPSKFVADKAEFADPFFFFGSSGNVSENVGVAAQHEKFGFGAPRRKKAKSPKKASFATRVLRRLGVAKALRALGLGGAIDTLRGRKPTPKPVLTEEEIAQAQIAAAAAEAAKPVNIPKLFTTMVVAARAGDAQTMNDTLAQINSRKILSKNQHKTVSGARSFLAYASGTTGTTLPLVWWAKPYPGNFGDWLGPLALKHYSGHAIQFLAPDGACKTPHLVAIGSIARFINPQSIVVGSGVSNLDTVPDPKAHYISLRGPITARVLREAGGPDVTSFGDPGLLLSRIFPVTRGTSNGRVALVRHYIHRKLYLNLPEIMDELSILLSAPDDIKAFVQTLAQYDSVITSAMHIYIICHSYGIPCALVTFEGGEDMVHGDGIKYIDYAQGAGIPETPPTVVSCDLRTVDIPSITTSYTVSEEKLDEIEKAVTDGIAAYIATQ